MSIKYRDGLAVRTGAGHYEGRSQWKVQAKASINGRDLAVAMVGTGGAKERDRLV